MTRRSRSGDIIGPAQRVDVITALKAMTIWPAWQKHEEATEGSIEVGKLADFVILSGDPTAVDSETLDQLEVVETIKWSRPHFLLDGKLLCGMSAFKAHCAFGFWQRAGAEPAQAGTMGDFGRLQTLADLPDRDALRRQIEAAAKEKLRKHLLQNSQALRDALPEVVGDTVEAQA